jgi:hypothetical protein
MDKELQPDSPFSNTMHRPIVYVHVMIIIKLHDGVHGAITYDE